MDFSRRELLANAGSFSLAGCAARQAPTFAALGITGANSDRDTARLLQALKDHREVITSPHPSGGVYLMEAPILVHSGTRLHGPAKVTLKASPGRAPHEPVLGNANVLPTWTPGSAIDDRDRGLYFSNLHLDGNREANETQGEWGHGLYLRAARDIIIGPGMSASNCRGDGLNLSSGLAANPRSNAYNSAAHCERVHVSGFRASRNYRQGVAIIAAVGVDGELDTEMNDLFGLDIEPDGREQRVRNITLTIRSSRDGAAHGTDRGGVSATGGGVAVFGAPGSLTTDVTLDINVVESRGYGLAWREVRGLQARGRIARAASVSVFGADGGSEPSTVSLALSLEETKGALALRGAGDRVTATINVMGRDTGASAAFHLASQSEPDLTVNASDGGGQQAFQIEDTTGGVFRGVARGFSSYGVWLRGASRNNRFEAMDLRGNGLGNGGIAVLEGDHSGGNEFSELRVGPRDKVQLTGRSSAGRSNP